jgi:hypothetical protein
MATTASPLLSAGICGYGHTIRGPQDTVLRAEGRRCLACEHLANVERAAVAHRDAAR